MVDPSQTSKEIFGIVVAVTVVEEQGEKKATVKTNDEGVVNKLLHSLPLS